MALKIVLLITLVLLVLLCRFTEGCSRERYCINEVRGIEICFHVYTCTRNVCYIHCVTVVRDILPTKNVVLYTTTHIHTLYF